MEFEIYFSCKYVFTIISQSGKSVNPYIQPIAIGKNNSQIFLFGEHGSLFTTLFFECILEHLSTFSGFKGYYF